jgi:CHAD domain-containing protein
VTSETTGPAGAAAPADEDDAAPAAPGGDSPPGPDDTQAQNGALFGRLSLPTAGARILLEQLERIEAHEPGARVGKDPEDVHRMRVATRRMRAARRVFRDALSEVIDLERANEELRALATVLGRARDLDVFIGALRRLSRTAPAADRPAIKAMVTDLQKQKATAQEELQRALDEGALTYLRSELHGQLQALAEAGGAGAGKGRGRKRDSVRRTAPRLIERALRRLYRDQDNLLAPTSTELHERRILAKRARYTMEYFAPAFGDALEEPIAHMTAVQDTLGEIHDADVAVAALLQRIEAVAGDAERTADAAALARLVTRYLERRDADLLTFRERWEALPGPKQMRRLLET